MVKLVLCFAFLVVSVLGADFAFETNELPTDDVMPTLANGHLGLTVFGPSILMNGMFNGFMGHSHRARIPNFANIQIRNCAREFKSAEDDCTYTLDEKHGRFLTTYVTEEYTVTHSLFADSFYDRTLVNFFTLQRTGGLTGPITANLHYDNGGPSTDVTFHEQEVVDIEGKTFTKYRGTTNEKEDSNYQRELREFFVLHQDVISELTVEVGADTVTWTHLTFVDYNFDVLANEAAFVVPKPEASHLIDHGLEWVYKWSKYGISVEGNDDLANAIHTSLFFLLSSLPSLLTFQTRNPFYGLAPSGLGRGGIKLMEYQGHSFWDTEMWMQPPLLHIEPKFSKELLQFRYITRQAALNHAKETDFRGIRFAWETGYTGREVTPFCCPETVLYQHHITADIAYAARSYFFATHDFEWLREEGCFLAAQSAEFWESHVIFNEETKLYEIKGVMGPDEDHSPINNNAYTNVVAAYNLFFGEFASCICRSVLGLSAYAVFDKWSQIGRSIVLPYDAEKDYVPQFDGYNDSISIKQADAILLTYPLQYPLEADTMKNNLHIYESVTREDGPAMTWAMHVIGHLDIGEFAEADQIFLRSYQPYIRKPFMVWSEVVEGVPGAGNFLTGAGGFLQAVINGYGGVRYYPDKLVISRTRLPAGTTQFKINRIEYLEAELSIEILATKTVITLWRYSSENPISIALNGEEIPVRLMEYEINNDQSFTAWPTNNRYGECVLPDNKIGIPRSGATKATIGVISVLVCIIHLLK